MNFPNVSLKEAAEKLNISIGELMKKLKSKEYSFGLYAVVNGRSCYFISRPHFEKYLQEERR